VRFVVTAATPLRSQLLSGALLPLWNCHTLLRHFVLVSVFSITPMPGLLPSIPIDKYPPLCGCPCAWLPIAIPPNALPIPSLNSHRWLPIDTLCPLPNAMGPFQTQLPPNPVLVVWFYLNLITLLNSLSITKLVFTFWLALMAASFPMLATDLHRVGPCICVNTELHALRAAAYLINFPAVPLGPCPPHTRLLMLLICLHIHEANRFKLLHPKLSIQNR
jgi:hypothetical protein